MPSLENICKYLLPEIIILFTAIIGILIASFNNRLVSFFNYLCLTIITLVAYICFYSIFNDEILIFNSTYILDKRGYIFKFIILLMFIGILLQIPLKTKINKYKETIKYKIEFYILLLFITLGCFVAISCRNFMLLYISFELISIPSYILAAYHSTQSIDQNNSTFSIKTNSSEAGIKYAILGGLSSAIMLFGISLIYGMTSSLDYEVISKFLQYQNNIIYITGSSLIWGGICFKFSLLPLHIWTPDVYQGSPSVSLGVFSSIVKTTILLVIINLIQLVYNNISEFYMIFFKIIAVGSMFIGAAGGIFQTSIKRIIAYSTILNSGLIFACLLSGLELTNAAVIYHIVYSFSIIALLTLFRIILGDYSENITIYDIQGIAKTNRITSFAIILILSSLIGIPPLGGFFVKFSILLKLLKYKKYYLFSSAIITSVISSYYYIKIIKMIYFVKPSKINKIHIENKNVILALLLVLFLIFMPFYPIGMLLDYNYIDIIKTAN